MMNDRLIEMKTLKTVENSTSSFLEGFLTKRFKREAGRLISPLSKVPRHSMNISSHWATTRSLKKKTKKYGLGGPHSQKQLLSGSGRWDQIGYVSGNRCQLPFV